MRWEDFTWEGSALERRIGFDAVEQKLVVETKQHGIDQILQDNVSQMNDDRPSTSLWNGKHYIRVASIPLWLIEKWKVEKGIDFFNTDHMPKITALLNSSEYSHLRTAPGRL